MSSNSQHESPPSEHSRSAFKVGYVLKKYPRLSETFILNEILGVENLGIPTEIYSLRLPDDGRFHKEVSDVQACAQYLPDGKGVPLADALSWISRHAASPKVLERTMTFCEFLPMEVRSRTLAQGLELARAAQTDGVTHLHAHFMTIAARTTCIAHLLLGIPFTVTTHAKDLYRHTVDKALFKAIAAHARAVITVCDFNVGLIEREFLKGAPGKVVRVYNGVPADIIQESQTGRENNLILGVGRLVEKKGFHMLLRVMRDLLNAGRDVRCVIVGDGDQAGFLQDERRRLGLEQHVDLRGAQPRDQVLGLMDEARVLVAPCQVGNDGNMDALPTVLIEAMARGLPVVSTDVSGIKEIIEHGSQGLIVSAEDVDALCAATQRMLDDDAFWHQCARRGPERVRNVFDRAATRLELLSAMGARYQPITGDRA